MPGAVGLVSELCCRHYPKTRLRLAPTSFLLQHLDVNLCLLLLLLRLCLCSSVSNARAPLKRFKSPSHLHALKKSAPTRTQHILMRLR